VGAGGRHYGGGASGMQWVQLLCDGESVGKHHPADCTRTVTDAQQQQALQPGANLLLAAARCSSTWAAVAPLGW